MSKDLNPPLPSAQIPRDPTQAWIDERPRVAVGRNVHIAGRLIFQEPVRIEGSFKGEVMSSELVVICAEAVIEGKVRAPRLLILGELKGDVVEAKRAVLGPGCRVNGRINAASLTICEGANFNGEISMNTLAEPLAPAGQR